MQIINLPDAGRRRQTNRARAQEHVDACHAALERSERESLRGNRLVALRLTQAAEWHHAQAEALSALPAHRFARM